MRLIVNLFRLRSFVNNVNARKGCSCFAGEFAELATLYILRYTVSPYVSIDSFTTTSRTLNITLSHVYASIIR